MIEQGYVPTDHPSGQNTYYDLETVDGQRYYVLMVEAYHKKQIFTGKEGTSIGFYFPLDLVCPKIGDVLTLKSW